MSQLLLRIEAALGTESDGNVRARLLSRKAGYLARVGRFDEAKEIVSALREDFAGDHSGRATIWIMLTEGLLYHFEKMSPQAVDRLNRALVLGTAIGDREVTALAAAWRAHIEFETSSFEAMFRSIEIAIDNSTDQDHAARARIFMVLCDAALLCGNRLQGQKWFLRSRDHALKDGDQASIEALLYNRAAFNMAWLRAQRCFGPISSDDLALVRLEVSSARNLQEMTGIGALTHYVHICDARLLILEGKYDVAVERLNALRSSTPYGAYNFDQDFFDLEVAYCVFRSGGLQQSKSAEALAARSFVHLDIDEQLVAAWMVLELSSIDQTSDAYRTACQHFLEVSRAFRETEHAIRSQLASFTNF
jgi:hypothetical protein